MKFVLRPAAVLLLSVLSFNLSAQKDAYKTTLLTLCETLISTQINSPDDVNSGALICPSSNPDDHPLHSRAAEAVYPFAVAWKLTGDIKYRDAAIKLGNWLIKLQETSGEKTGGWSEAWPDPEQKGWYGTTTDQLISIAGAFPILKPYMSEAEIEKWNYSMKKAAEFIMINFPVRSNINYNPTAAATLLMVYKVIKNPDDRWLIKADFLMNTYTLKSVTAQNFLSGEGFGVDEGYNISQSIGYIALYAILKDDYRIKRIAADLLRTHMLFVYPNGSVDNSWGTRSFKWSYESGTKTAPGIYFSFALLGEMDPDFNSAGLRCLEYLNEKCIQNGWIGYGPHSENHKSSSPPCNYSTFARAQSLALAIEYSTQTGISGSFPADRKNWYRFFPDLKVAVVRTDKIMATVSAYGEISRYPRASVCRGGSISNLWYEGFGENGFMESSSTSSYKRIEPMHMPVEKELLPLTSRIEYTVDSTDFSNIFEANGNMNVIKLQDNISVSTAGNMQTIDGIKSKVNYSLTNSFYDSFITKEYKVEGDGQAFRIIEPIVNDPGSTFILKNDSTVAIRINSTDTVWELKIIESTVPFKITLGTCAEKYWCPFPAVEAYPVIISFNTVSAAPQTIKIYLGKKTSARF